MNHNITLGKKGEELALEYLIREGYKVIETNWRYRHKEIDIIAEFDNVLAIIEVKTRSNEKYGTPEEAVSETKQQFLIDAAEKYLDQKNIDLEIRFDIISIIKQNNVFNISHIKDAFHDEL